MESVATKVSGATTAPGATATSRKTTEHVAPTSFGTTTVHGVATSLSGAIPMKTTVFAKGSPTDHVTTAGVTPTMSTMEATTASNTTQQSIVTPQPPGEQKGLKNWGILLVALATMWGTVLATTLCFWCLSIRKSRRSMYTVNNV